MFYSLGAGHFGSLPLDARQHEEFFLTAAQSIFAVALLLRLKLSVQSGLVLLGLFLVQLGLGFWYRNDEASTITVLTYMAWLYIVLATSLLLMRRGDLLSYIKVGLLNHPVLDAADSRDVDKMDSRVESDVITPTSVPKSK